jgi:polyphosphate kinase 2 (PPK2 family)
MKRKDYEQALRSLEIELCALQDWVKHQRLRVAVVFEGRDAAGKGGTIKAITQRVSRSSPGSSCSCMRPQVRPGTWSPVA